MAFSRLIVCLISAGAMITITSADVANPASNHLTNNGQSELPLMYRSLIQNSNPSENNKIDQQGQGQDLKDKPNNSNTVKNDGNQPSTPSQETGKAGEFFWPKSIAPFSDKSSPSTEDKTKTILDQTPWRNFNATLSGSGNKEMPQFFETPAGPPGVTLGPTTGPKSKGVAFWPRKFDTPKELPLPSNSDNNQFQGVNKDSIPKEKSFPELSQLESSKYNEMNRNQVADSNVVKNDPEHWKAKSSESNYKATKNLFPGSYRKHAEGGEIVDNEIQTDPKRATSPFSPREDFTSKASKDDFKVLETNEEPQPPFTATDSFKLPPSKQNNRSRFLQRKRPIIPSMDMINMATGTGEKSAKIMAQLTRRKGLAPGDKGDRRHEPETSDPRRRWGLDVPDRIKELRQNHMNKQTPIEPLRAISDRVEFKSTTTDNPLVSLNNDSSKDNKNQAWSTMSFGKRRLRLSQRLAELMSKNRVSRRLRLFGGIDKNEDNEVKSVYKP